MEYILLELDYGMRASATAFGAGIASQVGFCLTLAALAGRNWFVSFAFAAALLGIQAATMTVGNPSYDSRELWGACCVPGAMLFGCIPLIALRLAGWRLTTEDDEFRERLSIEGLFLTTLVVACCLVTYQFPIRIWQLVYAPVGSGVEGVMSAREVWGAGATAIVAGTILAIFAIIPTLLLGFCVQRKLLKTVGFAALLGIVVAAVALTYSIGASIFGENIPSGELWTFAIFCGVPAVLVYWLHVLTLYWAGFRFRRLRKPPLELAKQSETPLGQSSGFDDEEAAAKPPNGLITVPRCIACFVLLSTFAGAVYVQSRVADFERKVAEYDRLIDLAERNGGDLEFMLNYSHDKPSWGLRLWPDATSEDLGEFSSLRIRKLEIVEGSVTPQALAGLEHLDVLDSLTLTGEVDVKGILAAAIQSLALRNVTIRDTELHPSDLNPLAGIELATLDLGGCSFSPILADEKVAPLHIEWLYASDCELTDDIVRNWISAATGTIRLPGNRLKGDFDFCGESEIYSNICDLSRNPLDDDLFGRHLVGKIVVSLELSDTRLRNPFFQYLAQVKSINWLTLGGGELTEDGLAAADPPQLARLVLRDTQFTGHCFKDWHPQTLRTLDLTGSSADDATLGYLSNLKGLKELYLTQIKTGITAQGLLNANLPQDLAIWIEDDKFTSVQMQQLQAAYPNLRAVIRSEFVL